MSLVSQAPCVFLTRRRDQPCSGVGRSTSIARSPKVAAHQLLPGRNSLDVGRNVAGEKSGKAVPDRRHSDGHSEGSKGKSEGGGPECRPVDTVEREKIIGNNEQNQDAKAGHSTRSRREPDLIPWKTAKRGFH